MSLTRKVFLFVAVPLVVLFAGIAFISLRPSGKTTNTDNTQATKPTDTASEEVKFTSQIFDPSLINFITPLGELNGGYSEWQATTGVMVNIKPELVADGQMINVYAPTAMTLDAYSYHTDPRSPGNSDWTLIFRINKNIILKYDHITKAVDRIVAVTTSTPSDRSNELSPQTKISFTAGELVAQTHGTKQAKNWNIYMTDKAVANKFVNQARYEKSNIGYRFINGVCPFNYYSDSIKSTYLALMGATKAGQSQDCGNPSNDVEGTLAGTWFFEEASSEEGLDGNFASPLSIYKDSAGRVIIDQIANTQFRMEGATDPIEIKDEYCYKLATDGNKSAGYAYLKLVTPTSIQLAYGSTGSCPNAMPTGNVKTYYR